MGKSRGLSAYEDKDRRRARRMYKKTFDKYKKAGKSEERTEQHYKPGRFEEAAED